MNINKFIIYNPKTELFNFFIESLYIEFKKRNINICSYNQTLIETDKNDIILIIINPHFIYDYIEIKNEIINISKNYKYKILYLSEPIKFLVEKNVYLELIKMIKPYCLWTYTYENFNKINTYLNIFKIFPNYNDAYNFNIHNTCNKNTQKIIFFGNINENRQEICNQFNNYLINKTDTWTKIEWTEILNNYLFYLNIHRRNNCKSFESFRIIPILANGGVIFSERTNIKEENEYKNYNIIFVEKQNLYNTFIDYIKNINYDIINQNMHNFRNNMNININIDKYLNFHNTL